MTAPLVPNIALLREVLDQIDTHPESWDQLTYYNDADSYLCGTTHCIAGWALALSGEYNLDWYGFHRKTDQERTDTELAARALLGITHGQAWDVGNDWGLFDCDATRKDIGRMADKLAAEAGVTL